ncbi:zeta toxin family protein [Aggregatibacter actinomycetemcomitans]|uniref:zeta toxin family protein n=1 Tax=Aggregatibacter actinomycetemcomitans TaxID=714 RepID=UPI003BB4BF55
MVAKIRDEAIKYNFNILIEGTFRTIETPKKELKNFRLKGYHSEIVICTCPKELSWESTRLRAKELEEAGLQPRYVPQEIHDFVVDNLGENVKKIFDLGLVSRLEIYSRSGKLFDSEFDDAKNIENIINSEIHSEVLSKMTQQFKSTNQVAKNKIAEHTASINKVQGEYRSIKQ